MGVILLYGFLWAKFDYENLKNNPYAKYSTLTEFEFPKERYYILEPPNCDTISKWMCSILLIVVLIDVF